MSTALDFTYQYAFPSGLDLLEVLLENQSAIRQPLTPEACDPLKSYKGSSKAA
jgi:hypothetical protein